MHIKKIISDLTSTIIFNKLIFMYVQQQHQAGKWQQQYYTREVELNKQNQKKWLYFSGHLNTCV